MARRASIAARSGNLFSDDVGVPDFILLDNITEEQMLTNLRVRFQASPRMDGRPAAAAAPTVANRCGGGVVLPGRLLAARRRLTWQ